MKTMKTGILVLTFLFGVSINGQCLEKGDNIIDLSFGGPGFSDYFSNNTLQFGPITGKVEHMFTDNVGVGVDINFQENSSIYHDYLNSDQDYKQEEQIIRFMATLNFHLTTTEDFDTYLLIGSGYISNNSTVDDGPIPYTLRIGVGARYFITKGLGLNLEFGAGGGSILQGGLTFKL